MNKMGWENGNFVSKAKVTIDGTIYEVEPAQYSGKTPMSAENLKKMEDNIEKAINGNKILVITTSEIKQNINYKVPLKYHVGKNELWIYFEGTLLIKDENYIETGIDNEESSTIQFKDWDVPVGSKLEFLYK